MATMKEVVIDKELQVEKRTVSVPKPAPGEVLIKVEVCGSNPKDWKTYLVQVGFPINMGDDIAGTVAEVGEGVVNFKPGDRVVAFHRIQTPNGGWAQYAIAPAFTTAHIADNVSFEEASTVPLAGMTAALAMYRVLRLPQPWAPAQEPTPLLVYGASSAVGAFAVKLAKLSGIHPIVGVAGAGCDYVRTILDEGKGDVTLDYRGKSPEQLEGEIRTALKGAELRYAFDAVALGQTTATTASLLVPGGHLAAAMPPAEGVKLPEGVSVGIPVSPEVHGYFPGMPDDPGARNFGLVMMQAFAAWLADGSMKAHPFELVPGGLDAIPQVLANMKDGKASAKKFVFQPSKTADL